MIAQQNCHATPTIIKLCVKKTSQHPILKWLNIKIYLVTTARICQCTNVKLVTNKESYDK